jgi:hypothetical protein
MPSIAQQSYLFFQALLTKELEVCSGDISTTLPEYEEGTVKVDDIKLIQHLTNFRALKDKITLISTNTSL